MNMNQLSAGLLAAGLFITTSVSAADQNNNQSGSDKPLTIAVFGDWP